MNFDPPEKEVVEQVANVAMAVVLVLALFLTLFLAGCGAGNLSINGAAPVRVSECAMTPDAAVTYTLRGKRVTESVRRAYFENTFLSPSGSDLCQEMGLLCGGGR